MFVCVFVRSAPSNLPHLSLDSPCKHGCGLNLHTFEWHECIVPPTINQPINEHHARYHAPGGIGKPGIDAGRGIGLRFPRFIRAREDKPPENATSAQQIRDMYFDQQCVDSSNANAGTAAADDDDEYL